MVRLDTEDLAKKSFGSLFLLKKMLSSKNLMLRMRAIEALALIEKIDPIPCLIDIANVSVSSVEVLLILNTVTFFRDHHGFELNPKSLKIIAPKREYYRRIEYFSKNYTSFILILNNAIMLLIRRRK